MPSNNTSEIELEEFVPLPSRLDDSNDIVLESFVPPQKQDDDSIVLESYTPPQPQESSSIARRVLGDSAVAAAQGIVSLPEALIGIADIPTFGLAGKAAESLGVDFPTTQQELSSYYSPEAKQAQQEVAEAEGFGGTVGAILENPSTIATTSIKSLPLMLGGGAIGRTVLGRLAGRAGKKAADLSRAAKIGAAAAGEGTIAGGSAAEQIRQQTESGLLTPKQAAIAASSGAATALLNIVGGRLNPADIDTLFTAGVSDAVKKSLLKRVASGMVVEGLIEELPQSAQEQAAQNLALGKPIGEGVAQAAAEGMFAGMVMGGFAGAIPGKPTIESTEEKPAEPIDDRPTFEEKKEGEEILVQDIAVPASETVLEPGPEFDEALEILGTTAEEYRLGSLRDDDLVPTPPEFKGVVEIKKSPIEGKGSFTTQDFDKDTVVAPGFVGIGRTEFGRHINHSANPNVRAVATEDGNIDFVSNRPIEAGEELTTNYVQVEEAKKDLKKPLTKSEERDENLKSVTKPALEEKREEVQPIIEKIPPGTEGIAFPGQVPEPPTTTPEPPTTTPEPPTEPAPEIEPEAPTTAPELPDALIKIPIGEGFTQEVNAKEFDRVLERRQNNLRLLLDCLKK